MKIVPDLQCLSVLPLGGGHHSLHAEHGARVHLENITIAAANPQASWPLLIKLDRYQLTRNKCIRPVVAFQSPTGIESKFALTLAVFDGAQLHIVEPLLQVAEVAPVVAQRAPHQRLLELLRQPQVRVGPLSALDFGVEERNGIESLNRLVANAAVGLHQADLVLDRSLHHFHFRMSPIFLVLEVVHAAPNQLLHLDGEGARDEHLLLEVIDTLGADIEFGRLLDRLGDAQHLDHVLPEKGGVAVHLQVPLVMLHDALESREGRGGNAHFGRLHFLLIRVQQFEDDVEADQGIPLEAAGLLVEETCEHPPDAGQAGHVVLQEKNMLDLWVEFHLPAQFLHEPAVVELVHEAAGHQEPDEDRDVGLVADLPQDFLAVGGADAEELDDGADVRLRDLGVHVAAEVVGEVEFLAQFHDLVAQGGVQLLGGGGLDPALFAEMGLHDLGLGLDLLLDVAQVVQNRHQAEALSELLLLADPVPQQLVRLDPAKVDDVEQELDDFGHGREVGEDVGLGVDGVIEAVVGFDGAALEQADLHYILEHDARGHLFDKADFPGHDREHLLAVDLHPALLAVRQPLRQQLRPPHHHVILPVDARHREPARDLLHVLVQPQVDGLKLGQQQRPILVPEPLLAAVNVYDLLNIGDSLGYDLQDLDGLFALDAVFVGRSLLEPVVKGLQNVGLHWLITHYSSAFRFQMEHQKPLDATFASILTLLQHNARSLETVAVQPHRLLDMLTHTSVCLEQAVIAIDDQVAKAHPTTQILFSLQVMLSNLIRWLAHYSADRPVPSNQNLEREYVGSDRCKKCEEINEAVYIRSVREQLLGYEGVMRLFSLRKAEKDAEDEEEDQNFWDFSSASYNRNKHNLSPKADPYLTHWYAQEKLKRQNLDQMNSSILRQIKSEDKQFAEDGNIDELIFQLISNFKNSIGSSTLFQRIQKLLQEMKGRPDEDQIQQAKQKQEVPRKSVERQRILIKKIPAKLRIREVDAEKRYIYTTKRESKEDDFEVRKSTIQAGRIKNNRNSKRVADPVRELEENFDSADEKPSDSSMSVIEEDSESQDEADAKNKSKKRQKNSAIKRRLSSHPDQFYSEEVGTDPIETAEYGIQCELRNQLLKTMKNIDIRVSPQPNIMDWGQTSQTRALPRQANEQNGQKLLKKKKQAKKGKNSKDPNNRTHVTEGEKQGWRQNGTDSQERVYRNVPSKQMQQSFPLLPPNLKSKFVSPAGTLFRNSLHENANRGVESSVYQRRINTEETEIIGSEKRIDKNITFLQERHNEMRSETAELKSLKSQKRQKGESLFPGRPKDRQLLLKNEQRSHAYAKKSWDSFHTFEQIISSGKSELERKIKEIIQISQGKKARVPKISHKNSSSVFDLSDLDIFGGISEAFKWETQTRLKSDYPLCSEKDEELVQEIVARVYSLAAFQGPFFNNALMILTFPYSSVSGEVQSVEGVTEADVKKAVREVVRVGRWKQVEKTLGKVGVQVQKHSN